MCAPKSNRCIIYIYITDVLNERFNNVIQAWVNQSEYIDETKTKRCPRVGVERFYNRRALWSRNRKSNSGANWIKSFGRNVRVPNKRRTNEICKRYLNNIVCGSVSRSNTRVNVFHTTPSDVRARVRVPCTSVYTHVQFRMAFDVIRADRWDTFSVRVRELSVKDTRGKKRGLWRVQSANGCIPLIVYRDQSCLKTFLSPKVNTCTGAISKSFVFGLLLLISSEKNNGVSTKHLLFEKLDVTIRPLKKPQLKIVDRDKKNTFENHVSFVRGRIRNVTEISVLCTWQLFSYLYLFMYISLFEHDDLLSLSNAKQSNTTLTTAESGDIRSQQLTVYEIFPPSEPPRRASSNNPNDNCARTQSNHVWRSNRETIA